MECYINECLGAGLQQASANRSGSCWVGPSEVLISRSVVVLAFILASAAVKERSEVK